MELNLKTNTNLSVRAIADLLGINRGIVQKTKLNKLRSKNARVSREPSLDTLDTRC